MPDGLTVGQLASMDGRSYVNEIKSRLRDDEAWVQLLDPALIGRTRWGLGTIIVSIDKQKERVLAEGRDDRWLNSVEKLRRYAKERFDRLPPVGGVISGSRDARLWRAFSARVARALEEVDPDALDDIYVPHGGLTAAQWLAAREEKGK